jgi:benzoyl-CoA reductase/2-hydroxyglutaryl-CoA dehydratase subunit BcrC/BadD/HgdB
MTEKIGFTSTVPVEVILAAGYMPVDLNNIFINSGDPLHSVLEAERKGFPRNLCAWIKGIYTAAKDYGIGRIICIGEGDCASSVSMCEVAHKEGIEIIPFSYPSRREPGELEYEIEHLAKRLGTSLKEAENVRIKLSPLRSKLRILDELTWNDRKVSGSENHYWLVSSSDFNGDPVQFEQELDIFLSLAEKRDRSDLKPIAYIGVPPIIKDFYSFLNELGLDAVYNETQRQFAFVSPSETLVEQYSLYTYPYGITFRLENDILPEIKKRGCIGAVHYVQSFCHRQIEDIILREKLHIPLLTLEMDKPGVLDNRSKIRLEAFTEML